MPTPGTSQYRLVPLTADGVVTTTPCRIMAIEFGDTTVVSKLEFTDDADGSGTNVLVVSCGIGGDFRDYTAIGGITFPTRCFLDLTGATWVGVWVDDVRSV